jgi:hypothetical protein
LGLRKYVFLYNRCRYVPALQGFGGATDSRGASREYSSFEDISRFCLCVIPKQSQETGDGPYPSYTCRETRKAQPCSGQARDVLHQRKTHVTVAMGQMGQHQQFAPKCPKVTENLSERVITPNQSPGFPTLVRFGGGTVGHDTMLRRSFLSCPMSAASGCFSLVWRCVLGQID